MALQCCVGFCRTTQISHCCCSAVQSCPALCDLMDCSIAGFPILHYFPEFAQTHVHWVNDAIQPPHPLLPLISGSDGKACNAGDPVRSLGRKDQLEKEMATPPVLLPGKSYGWRSLVGYSLCGHKESDTT